MSDEKLSGGGRPESPCDHFYRTLDMPNGWVTRCEHCGDIGPESRERFEEWLRDRPQPQPQYSDGEYWLKSMLWKAWQAGREAGERDMAERAARIADDDLLGNDEIAPWTQRADNGHTAATAQRIARKIRALAGVPAEPGA